MKDILAQQEHLEELYKRVTIFGSDPEMQSHWAKYLCVLTSGFIENAIRYFLAEYSRKSHPYVHNYVQNQLSGFQNPNMEKILILVGSFSEDWRKALDTYVSGERKDAIDSIVANRHNIVHGKPTGLTFSRMKRYFEKASEVIEFIKVKCQA